MQQMVGAAGRRLCSRAAPPEVKSTARGENMKTDTFKDSIYLLAKMLHTIYIQPSINIPQRKHARSAPSEQVWWSNTRH